MKRRCRARRMRWLRREALHGLCPFKRCGACCMTEAPCRVWFFPERCPLLAGRVQFRIGRSV